MRDETTDVATVLVCDDEAVLRALVRATLEGGPFAVVEAQDGDEALGLALETRPDLILLDMMMPGRSGLQILAELRADRELADVPVVMLTARAQAADRERAETAGADRFLAKPFSPAQLLAVAGDLTTPSR